MRILIDTHYVLWAALSPMEMKPWARRILEDLKNEISVSAASVYEISLKVRVGKLPDTTEFESDLLTNIEQRLGFELLSLDSACMYRAARSEHEHADPFDRMLAAHSIQHNLPLLSVDSKLDDVGVRRIDKPMHR